MGTKCLAACLCFPQDPVLLFRKMTLIDRNREGCGWVGCGKSEVTAIEHKSKLAVLARV